MPGLLDLLRDPKFFQNPQLAMAAGLLSPTPNRSLGQGLLQGLQAGNAQSEANLQQQEFAMKEQLIAQKQQEALAEQERLRQLQEGRRGVSAIDPAAIIERIQAGDMEGAQALISAMNATKPGAPTIGSISVGGQLDPFFESLQKSFGSDFVERKKGATDAANAIRNSASALELLNQGITSGRGANALNYLGGALKTVLGIDIAPDARANAQAFGALMATQTAQIIKQFGAGTGLSDADREYALKAAGGDIEMEEDAIRNVLRINAEANSNLISSYNKDAAQIMNQGSVPYNLMVDLPSVPDFTPPKQSMTADEIADRILNEGEKATGTIKRGRR